MFTFWVLDLSSTRDFDARGSKPFQPCGSKPFQPYLYNTKWVNLTYNIILVQKMFSKIISIDLFIWKLCKLDSMIDMECVCLKCCGLLCNLPKCLEIDMPCYAMLCLSALFNMVWGCYNYVHKDKLTCDREINVML